MMLLLVVLGVCGIAIGALLVWDQTSGSAGLTHRLRDAAHDETIMKDQIAREREAILSLMQQPAPLKRGPQGFRKGSK